MADNDTNDGQGFAGMDPDEREAAAKKGGENSGGNFKNDPERASKEGQKGGEKSRRD